MHSRRTYAHGCAMTPRRFATLWRPCRTLSHPLVHPDDATHTPQVQPSECVAASTEALPSSLRERLSGVGFFLSPLPEAGGGKGEGEELGVVAGPTHPHPHPPPSRGREKKGHFRKNLPQKGARVGVQSLTAYRMRLPPIPTFPHGGGKGSGPAHQSGVPMFCGLL